MVVVAVLTKVFFFYILSIKVMTCFHSIPMADCLFLLGPDFKFWVCSPWILPACWRMETALQPFSSARKGQGRPLRCGQTPERTVGHPPVLLWAASPPATCALEPYPLTHLRPPAVAQLLLNSKTSWTRCLYSVFNSSFPFLGGEGCEMGEPTPIRLLSPKIAFLNEITINC